VQTCWVPCVLKTAVNHQSASGVASPVQRVIQRLKSTSELVMNPKLKSSYLTVPNVLAIPTLAGYASRSSSRNGFGSSRVPYDSKIDGLETHWIPAKRSSRDEANHLRGAKRYRSNETGDYLVTNNLSSSLLQTLGLWLPQCGKAHAGKLDETEGGVAAVDTMDRSQ